ncbi:MAG: Hpt domain-containing protein [Pirellulales bacterium]
MDKPENRPQSPLGENGASPAEARGYPQTESFAKDGVFDYDDSLARLGGDSQLFNEVVDIFLEDAPKLLSQASTSLAAGDSATLERAAHTLKGLSANFAAAAVVAAGYAVELLARERRLDGAAVCFPRLETELHRLEAALRDFRGQHS